MLAHHQPGDEGSISRQAPTQGQAAPSRKAQPHGLAAARNRFDGSMAQSASSGS
jgi:hypothetical protein